MSWNVGGNGIVILKVIWHWHCDTDTECEGIPEVELAEWGSQLRGEGWGGGGGGAQPRLGLRPRGPQLEGV